MPLTSSRSRRAAPLLLPFRPRGTRVHHAVTAPTTRSRSHVRVGAVWLKPGAGLVPPAQHASHALDHALRRTRLGGVTLDDAPHVFHSLGRQSAAD
jgi:hypothetical protein